MYNGMFIRDCGLPLSVVFSLSASGGSGAGGVWVKADEANTSVSFVDCNVTNNSAGGMSLHVI